MAEALAELGADIVVLDNKEEIVKKQAQKIQNDFKVRTLPLALDLANDDQVRGVAQLVVKELGRLDILINCAAFVGTSDLKGWITPFLEQQADTWRQALDVNLTAPFVLTQACTEALKKSEHGSVINVGSTYGVMGPDMSLYEGTQMGNPAGYAASKGGLIQLTRWLSTVLAPSIRVNSISPGGVWRNQPESFVNRYVERTPLKRMASEEDFKGAVAFLASDLSLYVTGQNLMVDGGWTIW